MNRFFPRLLSRELCFSKTRETLESPAVLLSFARNKPHQLPNRVHNSRGYMGKARALPAQHKLPTNSRLPRTRTGLPATVAGAECWHLATASPEAVRELGHVPATRVWIAVRAKRASAPSPSPLGAERSGESRGRTQMCRKQCAANRKRPAPGRTAE